MLAFDFLSVVGLRVVVAVEAMRTFVSAGWNVTEEGSNKYLTV